MSEQAEFLARISVFDQVLFDEVLEDQSFDLVRYTDEANMNAIQKVMMYVPIEDSLEREQAGENLQAFDEITIDNDVEENQEMSEFAKADISEKAEGNDSIEEIVNILVNDLKCDAKVYLPSMTIANKKMKIQLKDNIIDWNTNKTVTRFALQQQARQRIRVSKFRYSLSRFSYVLKNN